MNGVNVFKSHSFHLHSPHIHLNTTLRWPRSGLGFQYFFYADLSVCVCVCVCVSVSVCMRVSGKRSATIKFNSIAINS